jgi:hypothetical protein
MWCVRANLLRRGLEKVANPEKEAWPMILYLAFNQELNLNPWIKGLELFFFLTVNTQKNIFSWRLVGEINNYKFIMKIN